MNEITLTILGGRRGSSGTGYGSFAVMVGSAKTITHVEFGSGMTPHEAEYDILITALRSLKRQGSVSHLSLIIKSSSKLVVNQLSGQWKVSAPSLSTRRERVFDLLNEAADYSIQLVPRTAIEHLLTR